MKCLAFNAIWLALSCSWARLLDWPAGAFFLHIFSTIVIYCESNALRRSNEIRYRPTVVHKLNMQTEKRRHLRVNIKLPLALMTPYGLIQGEIINLSLGGALIQMPKGAQSGNGFPVISVGKYYSLWIGLNGEGLYDENRCVSVIGKVIGASNGTTETETKSREFRVCFVRPSVGEAQTMIKTISQYI
jgi:hypothetical protein